MGITWEGSNSHHEAITDFLKAQTHHTIIVRIKF